MGFKKEVRAFMALSKAEGSLIKQLMKQNQDLADRLMAKDLGEFKTYSPTFPETEKEEPKYDPTKDETTAGEMT